MRPPVRALVALIAVAGLVSAGDARAHEILRAEEPTPLIAAVRADLGFASAIGAVGSSLVLAAVRHVEVELGMGLGGSGLQLSLMPKLTLGDPQDHFVFGAGVSVAVPWNDTSATGHPLWLNVDAIGYEHLSRGGLAFLAAAGLTHGLGGGQACDNIICDDRSQLANVSLAMPPALPVGVATAAGAKKGPAATAQFRDFGDVLAG